MMDQLRLKMSYDRVASAYAKQFLHELDAKPLDRQMLDRFAGLANELGPICDLGCGPGHVTAFLAERCEEVLGIDLSAEMVGLARELFPELAFRQGDMLALPVEANAWGGIAALYSIIHLPRERVTAALRECWRVLRPGGWLLLSFHVGDQVIHLDEWYGQPVNIDTYFFGRDEIAGFMRTAGFTIADVQERPPYQEVEHPSRRCYILARKPVRPVTPGDRPVDQPERK